MRNRFVSILCVCCILLSLVSGAVPMARAVEESDWIPITQLPDNTVVTDRKWTYTKTTTVDSKATTMDGYTLKSFEWIKTGSGAAHYAYFPSGYDTSNQYYTGWMKAPYAASETATTKRTVNNSWAGYVYWHWMYDCGGGNGTSGRAIYNKKGYGPDNGFYYKYFGAFTSTKGSYSSDLYYCNSQNIRNYIVPERTSYASCQGALRWFRFDYYTSTYTDYYKLSHFEKVEELESSEKVTETTTEITDGKIVINNVQEMVKYIAASYVTFDANGGTFAPEAQVKPWQTEIFLTQELPVNGHYSFRGWATEPDAAEPTYQPGDSFAADEDVTLYALWGDPAGTCGENAAWSLSDGVLSITGTGNMAAFSSTLDVPWTDFTSQITQIRISDGISSIGSHAFAGCSQVTEVVLPIGMQTIGAYAFANCTGLQRIVLQDGLITVGDHAFAKCSALQEIAFPASVNELGASAFSGCAMLQKISLPANLTVLSDNLFEGCKMLRDVIIPGSVTKIGAYAFSNCSALTDLILPSSVKELGRGVFNHAGLITITIPDGVEVIGTGIFANISEVVKVRCYLDTPIYNYVKTNRIAYELMAWGKLEPPTFVRKDISGGTMVEISAPKGEIYYTIDGTDPTENSTPYTEPIATEENLVIRAIAVSEGWDNSDVASFNTKLEKVAEPYPSHSSGSKVLPGTEVTLHCDVEGAEIWYTTNKEIPTSRNVYTEPIVITEDTLIYAVAVKDGMLKSALVNFYYYITQDEEVPVITTNEATEIGQTSARVSATIEGGDVRYVEFVYYEKNNSKVKYSVEADENLSAVLEGLSPNTEYWYLARAVNDVGWNSGFICSFQTDTADFVKPTSIELDPNYLSMRVGMTKTLLATVLPMTADSRSIYWSSEDSSVATVDQNGVVTAVGLGNTRIRATTVSNRLVAYCSVDVRSSDLSGTFDFSEINMATNSSSFDAYGFDHTVDAGGNALMASAYLARWDGAVLESSDPYPTSLSGLKFREADADYHVQNILYLPHRSNALDNAEIKRAVMKYGAVYTSLKINYSYFSNQETDYYLPPNVNNYQYGHAVAIVGWDDNYDRTNFKVIPEGNGAFICRNSWGTGSGEQGYFYVSYYDKFLGKSTCGDFNAVFYDLQSNENYNKIYQYDYLGPVVDYPLGSKSAYVCNVFPEKGAALEAAETLEAVSFYSYSPGTAYEVYVVTDYRNSASLRQLNDPVKSGVMDYAGYFTVELDQPVQLQAGTRFAVVIKYISSSTENRIFVELPTTISAGSQQVSHSSNAKANADESYISKTGSSWIDFTAVAANANVCVKAFTKTQAEETAMLQGIDNVGRPYADDTVHTLEDLLEQGFGCNPAFANQEEGASLFGEADSETALGSTAPSVMPDLNTNHNYAEGCALPVRYDLREEGCLTAIRNQGQFGTCWTFAAYASLESAIMKSSAASSSLSADGLNQAGGSAASIELDPYGLVMAKGNQAQIVATVLPYGSNEKLVWTSSNTAVATVSSRGLVTGVGLGNAQITAETADGAIRATCSVTVIAADRVHGMYISNTEEQLRVGDQLLMDCEIMPYTAGNQAVIWSVDNQAAAAIDQFGVLTAKRYGTVTVTATAVDGGATASFTIQIQDDQRYRTEITEDALSETNGTLSGSLSLNVVNQSDEPSGCRILVAVYETGGKYRTMYAMDATLTSGDNPITFSDILVTGAADGYEVKVFTLDLQSYTPMTPLADPKAGT